MSEITAAKISLTWILAGISVYLRALAFPVILLVLSMLIDYGVGLMAASRRKDAITSYKSIHGITKKVCYLLLVAVGLILDCLICYSQETFGLSFSWSFVISAVIAVWVTINEIISILENIQDIGIILPAWLLPLVKSLKGNAKAIAPEEESEGEKK